MMKSLMRTGVALVLVPALFGMIGCARPYHVERFETPVIRAEHVVPGIEAEESMQKVLVAVRGQGLPPHDGTPAEKRFYAERAAIMDGYRRLVERVSGMMLESYSRSANNRVDQDQVITEARAYLKGAQIQSVRFEEGFATADVRVFLPPRLALYSTPLRDLTSLR